jgi:hypothetical protein
VIGPQYEAGAIHRWLFGDDYRHLWTAPVSLEVLDLESTAGGLTPVRRVGGQQTRSLALVGGDGRDWTFRSADKDPSSILPPDLQETIAERIVRDQVAAANPAGALVADRLMAAAGVLHSPQRLVVMPDDPALGEFREVFAGLPGTFEEYVGARPEAYGAAEVIDDAELHARVRRGPEVRADARAFLRARLLDVFIGDWDRHRGQWRWARVPGKPGWQPVPEDRDQAFSRFEGLVPSLAREAQPRFVRFGPEYPGIVGATFNGWEQDRHLLAELDWPGWEETARELQSRLTDAVIAEAVARMPPQYQRLEGERLALALRSRRDGMLDMARRYYLHLARRVDVRATDAAERIEVERRADGSVRVEVSAGEPADAPPYLSRDLDPADTEELRIHALGGDDRVVVRGRPNRILVRVIGGEGNDSLDDAAGGGTRFSEAQGRNRVVPGPGTHVDPRPYRPPPPNPRAPWIPPRDWGRRTLRTPWLGFGPDEGVFLGVAVTTDAYGFRRDPYASRQTLRAGYAVEANAFAADYAGEFRAENSGRRLTVEARASGIETLRFYGFGNETVPQGSGGFHRVDQRQLALTPGLSFPLVAGLRLGLGATFELSHTAENDDRFIAGLEPRPYGSDVFGQAGVVGSLRFDSLDRRRAASRGVLLEARGTWYPELLDVESPFGEVHGTAAAFLSAGGALSPTLALRAGGRRVFGRYPFHEAAFLGGSLSTEEGTSVRGLPRNRFAGDASLFANAELRLRLGRLFLLFPADFGVFGLADIGRVYLEGEVSKRWHHAWGGGVWIAFIDPAYTVSAAVARSEETTSVYVRTGFGF